MRRLLISAALLFSGSACLAQDGLFPEMLPYRVFRSLRPEQQEAYVRELRAMFVELSKNSVGYVDEASARKASLYSPFISEASAQESRAPSSPGNSCPNPVQACRHSREQRRRLFEQEIADRTDKLCVYAGMLSDYVGGGRRCRSKSEMTLQKKGGGSVQLKCGRGQALCNPLIFGVRSRAEPPSPFCVPRQMEATAACARISSPKHTFYFLRGDWAGGAWTQPYELEREWNLLKSWIQALCQGDGESRAFHCVECNVILERLREANYAVWRGRYCDARDYEMASSPSAPFAPAAQ